MLLKGLVRCFLLGHDMLNKITNPHTSYLKVSSAAFYWFMVSVLRNKKIK